MAKQENVADCPTCVAALLGGTVKVGATVGVEGRRCVGEGVCE